MTPAIAVPSDPAKGPRLSSLRRGSEDDFERWLGDATERLDPVMAWLGVLFALLVGYELAVPLSRGSARTLEIAGWVIWGVFLLEFAAKLWLSPARRRFLRRHWLTALALVLPTLRVLRFLRLVRLGRALPAARVVSSSYRAGGTARRIFRSRLGYLAAIGSVCAVAVAELAFLFERDHPQGVFGSFGDALLWSFSVVIGMQGDPRPASVGAQIAMLAGFAAGLVVIATLAGSIGSFLIDSRDRRRGPAER